MTTIYELLEGGSVIGEYDTEVEAMEEQGKFAEPDLLEIRVRTLNAFEDVTMEEALEIIRQAEPLVGIAAVARLIHTPDVTVRAWLRRGNGRLKPTQKLRIARLSALL